MLGVPLPYQSAVADSTALEVLPDHRGLLRETAVDFFGSPPEALGTLRSVESTLRQGREAKSFGVRMLIACVAALVVLGASVELAKLCTHPSDAQTVNIAGIALAGIAFLIALFVTRFKARCSYVGERGVARYTIKGHRQAPPREEVFLFEQASELYASQTRQYYNGIYTGTTYNYTWNDAAGTRLFHVRGSYRGKNRPPKAGDAWHFVSAAENAWSVHFLARAQQQLQEQGAIPFRVDKNRWVLIGPGFLEFHFGGDGPTRVTRDEIASVNIASGQFSFKHKDAKWYSRSGKFTFRYGAMANGKVFLLALDKLMGYRFG